MKTATISLGHQPNGGPVWTAIAAIMRKVAKASMRRRARRIAQANLHGVSDRTLKDIGIHRTEITSVVTDTTDERKR